MGEMGVAAAGSLISDRQGEGVLVGGVTNHDKEQEKSSLPHSCAACYVASQASVSVQYYRIFSAAELEIETLRLTGGLTSGQASWRIVSNRVTALDQSEVADCR